MLQSIPDPFDSYGPPKPEDQIFSILPPLDILNNAPSPSPSPLTATPETEVMPALAAAPTSWISNPEGYASSEWADVTSPPRSPSPPTSTTPTLNRSPSPPNSSSRRHSYPSGSSSGRSTHHSRKSETKQRNALPVIDEAHPDISRAREASKDTVRATSPEMKGRTQAFDFTWEQYGAANGTSAEDVSEEAMHSDFDPGSPLGHDPPTRSRSPAAERAGLQLQT